MNQYEKFVFYDGPLGRFAYEIFKGNAYLHLVMREWSIDAMREVRAHARFVLGMLKDLGVGHVYAYNHDGVDQKWPRFMERFGFTHVRTRNGLTLMEATDA